MTHWSRQYIGRPHQSGATGPFSYSCWGLVQHIFRSRHAIELPDVIIEAGQAPLHDNVTSLKTAAREHGFRRILGDGVPQDDDIVVMTSVVRAHVGLVLTLRHRTGVLHSFEGAGVVWQPWSEAVAGMSTELWRRQS